MPASAAGRTLSHLNAAADSVPCHDVKAPSDGRFKSCMLSCMSAFRFMINEVLGAIAGFDGPVVAGPVLDASGQLKVGDWLDIDAPSERIRVQCEGFPLLNWGRADWVSIAVLGLPSDVDVLGLVAESVAPGPDR